MEKLRLEIEKKSQEEDGLSTELWFFVEINTRKYKTYLVGQILKLFGGKDFLGQLYSQPLTQQSKV